MRILIFHAFFANPVPIKSIWALELYNLTQFFNATVCVCVYVCVRHTYVCALWALNVASWHFAELGEIAFSLSVWLSVGVSPAKQT